MMSQTRGPLDGVTVLELGHIVAGPTASLILAELGADVIKIERPGSGDQARLNKGNQGHFISYNSNKRSVTLDIQTESGKGAFLRLIDTADVLIDNFSPGAMDRLGLGFDVLSARNPQLIHGSIKGFLPGPYGHRALTDEPAQMMGGLAYMTGPKGRPLRAGTSIVDIAGAMFAAIGILAALHERGSSKRGRKVDVGLFESVVFLVGQHIAKSTLQQNAVPLPMPERGMGRDLGWGIYRIFSTNDGRDIFVAVLSNAHWERFCSEFSLHDLWTDQSLRTTNGRAEQHHRLGECTEKIIGSMTFAEATKRLEKAGLPFAPVNTPSDLIQDPHLRAIDFLSEVHTPDGQKGLIARLPLSSNGWFGGRRTDPPALGEHTAILDSLGKSQS
jgi:crotonobetainyl-CoA:carnitine CoA-transferase CaiB-like acyl-CoA transferase